LIEPNFFDITIVSSLGPEKKTTDLFRRVVVKTKTKPQKSPSHSVLLSEVAYSVDCAWKGAVGPKLQQIARIHHQRSWSVVLNCNPTPFMQHFQSLDVVARQ